MFKKKIPDTMLYYLKTFAKANDLTQGYVASQRSGGDPGKASTYIC